MKILFFFLLSVPASFVYSAKNQLHENQVHIDKDNLQKNVKSCLEIRQINEEGHIIFNAIKSPRSDVHKYIFAALQRSSLSYRIEAVKGNKKFVYKTEELIKASNLDDTTKETLLKKIQRPSA